MVEDEEEEEEEEDDFLPVKRRGAVELHTIHLGVVQSLVIVQV